METRLPCHFLLKCMYQVREVSGHVCVLGLLIFRLDFRIVSLTVWYFVILFFILVTVRVSLDLQNDLLMVK